MSLLTAQYVHFVGIKGVAMTSIAQCLADLGIQVSGSDIDETFVTQAILDERHFKLFIGFHPDHIAADVNAVIYTGAHQGRNNSEVKAAQDRNIPTYSQAQALGELMNGKKGISICGAGGKSTTSAMIAWILEQAELHPSYSVGVGNIPNLQRTGAYHKDSPWFVAEADEYAVDPVADHRPRFIFQHPQVIVCTNLQFDHPDIYATFEDTKKVFTQFFATLPENGLFVINGDDQNLLEIAKTMSNKLILRVGFDPKNDVVIQPFDLCDGKQHAKVFFKQRDTNEVVSKELVLQIPGMFNIRNAVMAWVVSRHSAHVSDDTCLMALREFRGTMRRFEYKGVLNGALVYDDYAHTPDEIKSTLAGLRSWCPDKKVIAVFQPHTYSRTRALFHDFAIAFHNADVLYLTDIFASAREQFDTRVSSAALLEQIHREEPKLEVHYVPTIEELSKVIPSQLNEQTVLITLGAGDIYTLHEKLLMSK